MEIIKIFLGVWLLVKGFNESPVVFDIAEKTLIKQGAPNDPTCS